MNERVAVYGAMRIQARKNSFARPRLRFASVSCEMIPVAQYAIILVYDLKSFLAAVHATTL